MKAILVYTAFFGLLLAALAGLAASVVQLRKTPKKARKARRKWKTLMAASIAVIVLYALLFAFICLLIKGIREIRIGPF